MTGFWFAVVVGLFGLYLTLAGIDYGVGMVLPFLGGDEDRRAALNAIGPMYLGNEVWVVGAGGLLYAAFPRGETAMFHLAYPVIVTVLVAVVAVTALVQLRSRTGAGKGIDVLIALTSAVTAVGWGVLLGALVTGALLTAYTLIMGLGFGLLLLAHGEAFLAWRTGRKPRPRIGVTAAAVVPVAGILARPSVSATVCVVAVVGALAGSALALRRGRGGLAFLLTTMATIVPTVAVASTVDDPAAYAAGEPTLRLLLTTGAPFIPVLILVQAACWWLFRRPADRAVYW
jgi:cytochrome d ubiquinol oxidase subunit II